MRYLLPIFFLPSLLLAQTTRVVVIQPDGKQDVYVHESTTKPVPPPIVAVTEKPRLGVNLTSPNDWTPPQFADAMKSARAPGSLEKPFDQTAPIDNKGWPTQDAGFRVLTENKEFGDFTLFWEGKADVSARGGTLKNVQFADGKGSATITVNGKVLELSFRNTEGGVRRVECYYPGHARGDLFHKKFLKASENAAWFRLMDWGRTNDSTVVEWDQYTAEDYANWRQVPYSIQFKLGAVTGKPVWVNVPAMVSDDFLRKFAAAIPANSKVYVEYSNEVWNGQFKQNKHAKALAAARVAAGDTAIDVGQPVNETYRAQRWIVVRSVEIKRIVGDRAKVVLCTQVNTGVPGEVLNRQLGYCEQNYGPPAQFFVAAGVAPYFSPGKTPDGKWYTEGVVSPPEIAARLLERYQGSWTPGTAACKLLSDQKGLFFYMYEGGIDLQQFANQVPEKIESQYLPDTGLALEKYYHYWFEQGGDSACQFVLVNTYSKNGYWGLYQSWDETEAPKFQAFNRTAQWVSTLPER
jgi:hypothetical protein